MTPLHSWDLTPAEAAQLQRELVDRLVLTWDGRLVQTVGGVDVSFKDGTAVAAIAVFSFPELRPLAAVSVESTLTFPYIPGLLSFREAPPILFAWEQLELKPDLLMFDGQGIAHPRGFGLAAHLGLWLQRPTIGVAKSHLYGHHDEPGREKGELVPIVHEREPSRVIGAVLRTRTAVKPVYVSPGYLIDVEYSVRFALACATKYRLPKPTRWAHRVAGGASLPIA